MQTSVGDNMTQPLFAGSRANCGPAVIDSYVNAEAAAEIPFGVMVYESGEKEAKVLAGALLTKLAGIVVHSHAYSKPTELGDTGITPDTTFGVLREGEVWVKVGGAVAPGGEVHVYHTVDGAFEVGTFDDAANAANTFDISAFAQWRSSTSGAGFAKLYIDMTGAAAVTADV